MLGLAHYRDQTAVDELIAVMNNDVRPMIRGTAAWSLGKIGTKEAYQAIEEALEKEEIEQVAFEMEKGLAFQSDRLSVPSSRRSEERRVGKECRSGVWASGEEEK